MTKLKTLKDIKSFQEPEERNFYRTGWKVGVEDFKQELRVEAVKWIKQSMKNYKMTQKNLPKNLHLEQSILHHVCDDIQEEQLRGLSIIAHFMYFFNIKKEDLK